MNPREKYFSPDYGGSVPAEKAPTVITPASSGETPSAAVDTSSISQLPDNAGIDDLKDVGLPDENLEDLNEPANQEPANEQAESMTEAELLAELGLQDYQDVRSAILDLKKQASTVQQSVGQYKPLLDKLNTISGELGMTPDMLIEALSGIDSAQVSQAPAGNPHLNQFLQEVDESSRPYVTKLYGAIQQDMLEKFNGVLGKMANTFEGKLNRTNFEFQMMKFLGNPKNEQWNGRNDEIWQVLQENPRMIGKPNAVDWATRFITAGQEPTSIDKRVNLKAKEIVQQVQARKKANYQEPAGRGAPTNNKSLLEIARNPAAANHEQLGQTIDAMEDRGFGISRRNFRP